MSCDQHKPGMIWCSASSDRGNPSCCRLCGLVQLGMLHIVKISSRRQMINCTLRSRLCMEDLWHICTLEKIKTGFIFDQKKARKKGFCVVNKSVYMMGLHDSNGSWQLSATVHLPFSFNFWSLNLSLLHAGFWGVFYAMLLGEMIIISRVSLLTMSWNLRWFIKSFLQVSMKFWKLSK